jgi:hypothetical protein
MCEVWGETKSGAVLCAKKRESKQVDKKVRGGEKQADENTEEGPAQSEVLQFPTTTVQHVATRAKYKKAIAPLVGGECGIGAVLEQVQAGTNRIGKGNSEDEEEFEPTPTFQGRGGVERRGRRCLWKCGGKFRH